MRRTLLGILASSLAITGFVPAANAQSGDSVTGQAQVQGSPPRPFVFNFSFDAHSGPSGEQPSGTVNGAPVTCLNVSGNQATIGAAIPGSAALFFVEDNNGAGQDRLAVAPFLPAPITVCPDPALISTIPLIQITSGDITVVDAPPLPTSKEQCRNGGWRNFGVFKNQGDCVSFVATGGKNPPGP